MSKTARIPATQQVHMLLGQLFTNEVVDEKLLSAFAAVPREKFVPQTLSGAAYVDDDLTIGKGRFLIAPLDLARMVQLAAIMPADKVLVVGSGKGYSLAVIASLAAEVTGCDTEAEFIAEAKKDLFLLGRANATAEKTASLAEGYAAKAPYDVIIIEGAVETVPEALKAQLAEHGRLVAAERIASSGLEQGLCKLTTYVRLGKGFSRKAGRDAALPLLPGFERKKSFVF